MLISYKWSSLSEIGDANFQFGTIGQRNISYCESWANTRACQSVAPEDLNLDGFTSINFAFSFFDPSTFTITSMDSNTASLYSRFTALKEVKPGMQTFISVGGWSFTDPSSTQKAFSTMVSSAANRAKFINGLVHFMDNYGFDGVDLDWEYPGADDHGGVAADTANYVALTKEMRAAFGSRYSLTVTIPTSYYYLQHFDLAGIQASIDWFNIMGYDSHGSRAARRSLDFTAASILRIALGVTRIHCVGPVANSCVEPQKPNSEQQTFRGHFDFLVVA
ncbi:hypothetical protein QQS21_010591 [Conoideocrella luteorostrata]|uniref:chitinase n=1 Tax=Conoideocrella luteorostrata TaxID=1105319 RepID=A0AAJ0CEV3_9HYPO|nr:hypothetical protein QQS21_010591 [Conoideocrella luteorostrata]